MSYPLRAYEKQHESQDPAAAAPLQCLPTKPTIAARGSPSACKQQRKTKHTNSTTNSDEAAAAIAAAADGAAAEAAAAAAAAAAGLTYSRGSRDGCIAQIQQINGALFAASVHNTTKQTSKLMRAIACMHAFACKHLHACKHPSCLAMEGTAPAAAPPHACMHYLHACICMHAAGGLEGPFARALCSRKIGA